MKKVKVELKGITPLLMNSPKSMIDNAGIKLQTKTKDFDLVKEAEKLTYRKESGELYVPSSAIKGSLINASSFKKIGKYAAKSIIAGGVFILEQEIGLGIKKYDLDIRTVVIQRARVVKSRPMIKDWKITFELQYNENMIGNSNIIKEILIEAGQRVGILDYRPQHYGSFGMFEVSKWEEIK